MSKKEKVTDTCIGCGKSFTTDVERASRYKIQLKSEDVWARQVEYKCPSCNLHHKNTQAKIGKPKR